MFCRGQAQSLLPCITTKIHGSKSADIKEVRLSLTFVVVWLYMSWLGWWCLICVLLLQ